MTRGCPRRLIHRRWPVRIRRDWWICELHWLALTPVGPAGSGNRSTGDSMKLRLPQRRVWRAAIYLGSSILVLVALDLVLVEARRKITPGFDTTRIVGPVMPDGSVDYLTAIEEHFGQGVTPQNNA